MTLLRAPLRIAAALACAASLIFACEPSPPGGFTAAAAVNGKRNGAADGDGGTTQTGLPCAVSDALAKNCQTCHGSTTSSGASTSLVTYDDLQKDYKGKKVFELVKDRVHAAEGRMPPAARLADADTKAIDDWVASGAPTSTDSCGAGGGPPPATQPFVCPDGGTTTVMKAATPFKWTDSSKTDQYMCFGADEIVNDKRHVIAMGPKIENLKIVHHVLLFQSDDAMPAEAQPCAAFGSTSWKLVAAWAPGGGNFELPPEAGFPEEKGTTHWVLQVHYNNAKNLTDQSDNSGYQICSTDKLRPNDAGVLAFGSQKFTIPPRTASYTIKCDYVLGHDFDGVKFFSAFPHMHTRGLSIGTERIPGGDGVPQTVFEQKPFNFENQGNFKLDHLEVARGDIMRTRCSWKNPDDTAINFGENTSDEMCFNFLSYYPAIPDFIVASVPVKSWISPSLVIPYWGTDCTEDN
jgi:mono/diheme cytochrome c family protein